MSKSTSQQVGVVTFSGSPRLGLQPVHANSGVPAVEVGFITSIDGSQVLVLLVHVVLKLGHGRVRGRPEVPAPRMAVDSPNS